MSILVSHWILLIPWLCMHIAHASARLLPNEDHVDHSRADIMTMKEFDPSGKANDNIKLKLCAATNYVEIRTRMLLEAGDTYSYKTPPPMSTPVKAPKEMKNKVILDESHRNTDTNERDVDHRERYSSVASTKHLDSFSSSQSQQPPQKSGIDKSSPGFFSDYSRPRMRPPSHNR